MIGVDTSDMSRSTQPRNLKHTSSDAAAQAREQASAYKSLFADRELELDDGTMLAIPPHPDFGMLDDDCMAAYEELQFEAESYARFPDKYIPEQRLRDEDGNETGIVLPEDTIRGELKQPYRRVLADGTEELVKPPHSVRAVQAALGDLKFKQLKEGGRGANDVWRIWGEQGMEVQERRGRLQAARRAVGLAPVPEADSQ